MKRVLALVLASLPALAAPARAQGPAPCPDTKATTVPRQEIEEGGGTVCYLSLEIGPLFIELRRNGERCPARVRIVPQHGECAGEVADGMRCVAGDLLSIHLCTCRCTTIGVSGAMLTLAECRCRDAGVAGVVRDFVTKPCPDGGDERENGGGR